MKYLIETEVIIDRYDEEQRIFKTSYDYSTGMSKYWVVSENGYSALVDPQWVKENSNNILNLRINKNGEFIRLKDKKWVSYEKKLIALCNANYKKLLSSDNKQEEKKEVKRYNDNSNKQGILLIEKDRNLNRGFAVKGQHLDIVGLHNLTNCSSRYFGLEYGLESEILGLNSYENRIEINHSPTLTSYPKIESDIYDRVSKASNKELGCLGVENSDNYNEQKESTVRKEIQDELLKNGICISSIFFNDYNNEIKTLGYLNMDVGSFMPKLYFRIDRDNGEVYVDIKSMLIPGLIIRTYLAKPLYTHFLQSYQRNPQNYIQRIDYFMKKHNINLYTINLNYFKSILTDCFLLKNDSYVLLK